MTNDFDNPLDGDFLDEVYKAKREVLGDDLIRPKMMVIGRLAADGSQATSVTSGEFGRVWVREPGDDTGDAIQAINTVLQPHEVIFNRPVEVKRRKGELIIVGKAPESADYDSDIPVPPQRPVNREQLNIALIRPTIPETSLSVYYRGGSFILNNTAYIVTDQPSYHGDSIPGANAISIKVELDPTTDTFHETAGGAFPFTDLKSAFDNGDLSKTRTSGRYLLGWIRLYAGQTSVENDDILMAEHMLDIIDDHSKLINLGAPADDHTQYILKNPTTDARNRITPIGSGIRGLTITGNGTSVVLLQIENELRNPNMRIEDDGAIIFGNNIDIEPVIDIRTPAGEDHWIYWSRASGPRWEWHTTGAEGGANAGTDLRLNSWNDAGRRLHSNVWFIKRSNSHMALGNQAPQARFHIDGDADEVQLRVDGHGTQNADAIQFGDPDGGNYSAFEHDGSLVFHGEAGLPSGSCYGNHIGWLQANAVQNTWYNISDADMLDGLLHYVTHDGNGKLTVTYAGRYRVGYSICFEDDVANDHIETGIEVSGSGSAEGPGQSHVENKFANEEEHLGSTGDLDLGAGATIEITIRTTDAVTPDIAVQALNIWVGMIGGT